jgi:hypothetical protein
MPTGIFDAKKIYIVTKKDGRRVKKFIAVSRDENKAAALVTIMTGLVDFDSVTMLSAQYHGGTGIVAGL